MNKLDYLEMNNLLDQFSSFYIKERKKLFPNAINELDTLFRTLSVIIPSNCFNPAELAELSNLIFVNENIRHFIYRMVFFTYSSCIQKEDFATALSNTLAESIAIDGPVIELSAIPDEIGGLLPANMFANKTWWDKLVSLYKRMLGKEETLSSFLNNNKHLVVLFLIVLSEDYILVKQNPPKGN